jgi:hypothetical protein
MATIAIGAIFKTPQSNCKMRSEMLHATRLPTYLAKSLAVNSVNPVLLDLLQ